MDNNVAAVPMSINLNYRGEGTIDITLTYTTEYLLDETMWVDETVWGKFESELDSWYDDEMDEVYLQFGIRHGDTSVYAVADEWTRCLVCMNVDENSEL